MSREYLWDDGNGERGPFTATEVRQLAASGTIRPEHRIRHAVTGKASLASQINGLNCPRAPGWRTRSTIVIACVCGAAIAYGVMRLMPARERVPTAAVASSANAELVSNQTELPQTSPTIAPPPSAVPAEDRKLDELIDKALAGAPTTPGRSSTAHLAQPKPAEEMFREVAHGVVRIETEDAQGNSKAQGSGFFIDPLGSVVTNYHVLEEAAKARVVLPNRAYLDVIGVLASSKEDDLAILVTAGRGVHFLEWRDVATPAVGTKVFAIGSPIGLDNTLSEGMLSGLRDDAGKRLLQTTAAISPGSSGGPLLDEFGRVLGVNTFFLKGGQNLNFAIPSSRVQAILERAIKDPIKIKSISEITGVSAENPKGKVSLLRQRLDDGFPFQARVEVNISDDSSGGVIKSTVLRELRKLSDVLVTDTDPQYEISIVVLPDEIRGQTVAYYVSWVVTRYDFRTENDGRMNGTVIDHQLVSRGVNVLEAGLAELVADFDTTKVEPMRRVFNRLRDERASSKQK